ncbi:unnamed protein product, partial [Durusdinium trenchii]
VQDDLNFTFVLQYLASFAHDLPHHLELKAAKRAVAIDNVETQMMPSPVSKLQLTSPSPKALVNESAMDVDDSDFGEENPEEEDPTQDECVEPIECHPPTTFVLDSGDETILSPRKGNRRDPELPAEAKSTAMVLQPPSAEAGASVASPADLLNESQ